MNGKAAMAVLNNGMADALAVRDMTTAGGKTAPAFRRVPPYIPFPVDALPYPIRDYVCQGAAALGRDPAYVALPVLGAVAGLIGYTHILRIKRTWNVPAALWLLLVADSGTLKTPAYNMGTSYLFVLQRKLDAEFKKENDQHQLAMEKYREAKKAATNGQGEDPGEPPAKPIHRSIFTSDATIEAIAELIGDNPRGLLVTCDELASWLGSFARYKGNAAGTDLPRWLSMHSAGGFAYHRRTGDRRKIVIPNAAVSVCGGIQPAVLTKVLTEEFLAAGLAARLLMAKPPDPRKVWSELEIDPDIESAYHSLLDRLLKLDFARRGTEHVPHVLRLSPEAKKIWVAWYDAWAVEQSVAEGEVKAVLAKIEEACARFALIHHIVIHAGLGESILPAVQAESMEAGIVLARWFAYEARRIYMTLTESAEEHTLRRLVEFIQAGDGKRIAGRITVKQLQNSNGRKYPRADDAEAALVALVEAGLGEWKYGEKPPLGGHRPRWLQLLPTADSSYSRPPEDSSAADTASDSRSDFRPAPSAKHWENERESEESAVGQHAPHGANGHDDVGTSDQESEASVGKVEEDPDTVEERRAIEEEGKPA